jgi:hypothetical protein
MDLAALCASHINCTERLNHFKSMISSYSKQQDTIPLYVSMSSDTDMNPDVIKFLIELRNNTSIKVYFNSEKQSQFNHYKILANKLKNQFKWYIFTDDDDLWSKYRVTIVKEILNDITKNNTDFAYIKLGGLINGKLSENFNNTEEIDIAWDSHTVVSEKLSRKGCGNYVDYIVKCKHLLEFVNYVSDEQLNHIFCDVLFSEYYLHHGHKFQTLIVDIATWIYYYRKCRDNQICSRDNYINSYDRLITNIDFMLMIQGTCTIRDLEKKFRDETGKQIGGLRNSIPKNHHKRIIKLIDSRRYLLDVPEFEI